MRKRNNLVNTLLISLMLCSAAAYATDPLLQIDLAVEKKAAQLDEKYGLLLTTAERNAVKLALIATEVIATEVTATEVPATEVTADKADGSALDIAEAVQIALTRYQITDPQQQRKLLIIFEAQALMTGGGGGSGAQPPGQ